MDVRKIESFIRVAETLSFSRAAAQLHISHQALSKQVQQLEGELGVRLLERSTTRVALTEAGRRAYDIFKPLMRELEQGYADLRAFVESKKKTLRIGYFNGLSYHRVMVPVARRLKQLDPELRVDMLATDIGLVRQLLEEDSIDMAVFPEFGVRDREGGRCVVLRSCPARLMVSENHPWYGRERVTAEDMAQGTLLVYGNRDLEGDDALLAHWEVAKRIPVYNFDTYMGVLWHGGAFGVVGDTYSRREGNYRLFDLPEAYAAETEVVAAYKPRHPQRALLRQLERCLEE